LRLRAAVSPRNRKLPSSSKTSFTVSSRSPRASLSEWPALGFGAGLRTEHYEDVLAGGTSVESMDWFEVVTENFMDTGGRPLAVLEQVRRDFPGALHGVGLSIG
jgi:hypothetical protein